MSRVFPAYFALLGTGDQSWHVSYFPGKRAGGELDVDKDFSSKEVTTLQNNTGRWTISEMAQTISRTTTPPNGDTSWLLIKDHAKVASSLHEPGCIQEEKGVAEKLPGWMRPIR